LTTGRTRESAASWASTHPFITHLRELYQDYLKELGVEVKRAARGGIQRTAEERKSDEVVEDDCE